MSMSCFVMCDVFQGWWFKGTSSWEMDERSNRSWLPYFVLASGSLDHDTITSRTNAEPILPRVVHTYHDGTDSEPTVLSCFKQNSSLKTHHNSKVLKECGYSCISLFTIKLLLLLRVVSTWRNFAHLFRLNFTNIGQLLQP